VNGYAAAVNLEQTGTQGFRLYRMRVAAGSSTTVALRLTDQENRQSARRLLPSNERNLKIAGAAAATSTAARKDCFGPRLINVWLSASRG